MTRSDCLKSLVESSVNIDILCIDNASQDKTTALIRERYPSVKLIVNKQNTGFGKANNIGFEYCLRELYDYAFLLNQDARVESSAVQELVNIHVANPIFGIISPLQRGQSNDDLEYIFSSWLAPKNTPQLISDFVIGNTIREVYETSFVNAAIWLVSIECLNKVGFFDPDFPHYGEDNDYARRVIKAGLKIGVAPNVLANHARYKVKIKKGDENFGSRKNRRYVELLVEYKQNPSSFFKKWIYFFRKMLVEVVHDLILFDREDLTLTFGAYKKLLFSRK
ncbi:MAG: glycosyltransferase family 2 protein [Pseudomonadales bacterium]|nr:glycosyltransferase family 2 protein [Pseudomonadales bacterium]